MEGYLGMIMLWAGTWAPQDWMFCQGQLLSVQQYQALYSLLGTTYGGDGRTTFALPDLRGRVPVGVGQQPSGGTNYLLGQYGGKEQNQASFSGGTSITVPLVKHNHTATASVSFNPITPTASASLSGLQVQVPASSTGTADTAAPGPTATLAKPKVSGTPGASVNIYTSAAPDTNLKPGGSVTGNVSVTVNPITITPASSTVTVADAGTGNTNPIPVNISGSATVSAMQPYQVLNYIICTTGLYPSRPD